MDGPEDTLPAVVVTSPDQADLSSPDQTFVSEPNSSFTSFRDVSGSDGTFYSCINNESIDGSSDQSDLERTVVASTPKKMRDTLDEGLFMSIESIEGLETDTLAGGGSSISPGSSETKVSRGSGSGASPTQSDESPPRILKTHSSVDVLNDSTEYQISSDNKLVMEGAFSEVVEKEESSIDMLPATSSVNVIGSSENLPQHGVKIRNSLSNDTTVSIRSSVSSIAILGTSSQSQDYTIPYSLQEGPSSADEAFEEMLDSSTLADDEKGGAGELEVSQELMSMSRETVLTETSQETMSLAVSPTSVLEMPSSSERGLHVETPCLEETEAVKVMTSVPDRSNDGIEPDKPDHLSRGLTLNMDDLKSPAGVKKELFSKLVPATEPAPLSLSRDHSSLTSTIIDTTSPDELSVTSSYTSLQDNSPGTLLQDNSPGTALQDNSPGTALQDNSPGTALPDNSPGTSLQDTSSATHDDVPRDILSQSLTPPDDDGSPAPTTTPPYDTPPTQSVAPDEESPTQSVAPNEESPNQSGAPPNYECGVSPAEKGTVTTISSFPSGPTSPLEEAVQESTVFRAEGIVSSHPDTLLEDIIVNVEQDIVEETSSVTQNDINLPTDLPNEPSSSQIYQQEPAFQPSDALPDINDKPPSFESHPATDNLTSTNEPAPSSPDLSANPPDQPEVAPDLSTDLPDQPEVAPDLSADLPEQPEVHRNMYPVVVIKPNLQIDLSDLEALKMMEPTEYSSSAGSTPDTALPRISRVDQTDETFADLSFESEVTVQTEGTATPLLNTRSGSVTSGVSVPESLHISEDHPASDLFISRLAGILPKDDVIYITTKQKYMLNTLECANEKLRSCNNLSAVQYEKAAQNLKYYTKLLVEMRRDVDTAFKRIHSIKGKLASTYPAIWENMNQEVVTDYTHPDEEDQQEQRAHAVSSSTKTYIIEDDDISEVK